MNRVVVWFSCGAASAVAAKIVMGGWDDHEVIVAYCDTGSEHPDNQRFLKDCEAWLGQPIRVLRGKYPDTWAVFERHRYLSGVKGARCTIELKKRVRQDFERPFEDVQAFGFDSTERHRANRFREQNPEVKLLTPLIDAGLTKVDCFRIIQEAGIELPAMYRLGYRNNNCIGCVKGQSGYWNKIRRDFPETFDRMAKLEREIGAAICKTEAGGKRVPVYLDELDPEAGRYQELPDMSCGLLCDMEN